LLLLNSVDVRAIASTFGPQQYIGTGRPQVSKQTFKSTGGMHTLRVRNDGVHVAFVVLNGRVVLRPSDFRIPTDRPEPDDDSWERDWSRMQRDWRADRTDRTKTLIEKTVRLHSGANEIVVAFISRRGTSFTLDLTSTTTDTTPPIITTSVAPLPNINGWNNTNTIVTFACSDAASGISTCPPPVTTTSEGANQQVSGTAVDNAGNIATAAVTLRIDKTAPAVSATVFPNPNANGWNNSPVTVSFAAVDTLSGIAPGTLTAPITLSADGTSLSAMGQSKDLAGNTGSVLRGGINIDTTAPTIDVVLSPPPNSSGLYSSPVTAHFVCADSGSGITSCPLDEVFTTPGTEIVATGTVADWAGNTASVTSDPFTIQLGKPTITVTLSPPANSNGWRSGAVTAHFICLENGSPLPGCPADQIVTTEGANQTVTGVVMDSFGQSASVSSELFNIDTTLPVAAATLSPAPNADGWNHTPVSVHFTCTDTGSGVANCSADSTVSADGVETLVGSAVDNAGNSGATSIDIRVDQVPPTVTVSTPSPGTSVSTSSVLVSGTFEDAGSGLSLVACNGVTATITASAFQCVVPLAPGANSIQVSASDRAGNSGAPAVVDVTRLSTSVLLSLRAVPSEVDDQTPTLVTFTATAVPVTPAAMLELVQYEQFPGVVTSHRAMFDDGTHGDGQSGDGIFTLQVTLDERGPKRLVFRANVNDGGSVSDAENSSVFVVPVVINQTFDAARSELANALRSGSLSTAYARLGRDFNDVRVLDTAPTATLTGIADALTTCTVTNATSLFAICEGSASIATGPARFEFMFVRDLLGQWRVSSW